MVKPDPYGDWVLFPPEEGETGRPGSPDHELIAAAREAWPHVLAHARKEFHQRGLGSDSPSLAAHVWEGVLRTIAKARQGNSDHRPPISDLQSYLIGAFHRRFNKALLREQKRAETIELISTSVDLELMETARDASWIERLEQSITIREVTDRMDAWTKKVWQAREYGYSWKEIAQWLGVTEQQAKMKFRYGLEKTRASIVRLLKGGTSKNRVS
jgi:DNA-directed RNA polymerase specialized sigma24 family protein